MGRPTLTVPQKQALEWLSKHSGDGCFDKNGVVLASGESAPFMRSTWNTLRDLGLVKFYGGKQDGGKGYGRIALIAAPQ